MTSLREPGTCLNLICPEERVPGEATPKTTANSSMPCSGSCAPELPGGSTGAPWRDLPLDLGHWSNTHRRFIRWRDKGIWEKLLEVLIEEPDFEWLMIDASHIKVHPHAAGARGGNQDMERSKGGSTARYIWPWMRLVCQSELLLQKAPQRIAHLLHV